MRSVETARLYVNVRAIERASPDRIVAAGGENCRRRELELLALIISAIQREKLLDKL